MILACERLAPGTQLARFADLLEPALGVRPDIPDVPTLFRVLYRLAHRSPALVVIDELPWLLPATETESERVLSSIQAVMEDEREQSRLKLILCGSAIEQMQALMSARGPLHGRLAALELRPLRYAQARAFLRALEPLQRVERFAIAGGVPRYLSTLGNGSVESAVCSEVLDSNGPLWNEARTILEQELKQPGSYFSILEQLATGEKEVGRIAASARMENAAVNRYLTTLADLRIVRRKLPVGARASSRGGHWQCIDPFLRFWFRFVFPYQAELESGLKASDLWTKVVSSSLPDHTASVFEDICREWTRAHCGHLAQRVGGWWGNARNDLRHANERTTEEIDIVGLAGNRVVLIGECRWRSKAMDATVIKEIEVYKLPALRQAGFQIDKSPRVLLFSRSGHNRALERAAAERDDIRLIPLSEIA